MRNFLFILILLTFLKVNSQPKNCVDSFLDRNAFSSKSNYILRCNINDTNVHGNTILKSSVLLGNVKLVRWTLQNNADPQIGDAISYITFPNISEPCNNTKNRVCKNEKSMVEILNVFYNESTINDSIITHLAFLTAIKQLKYQYNKNIFKLLYKKRINYSYLDANGNNYLQIALLKKNYSTFEWLLSKERINVNNKNKDNLSLNDILLNDVNVPLLIKKNLFKLIAIQKSKSNNHGK